MDEETYFDLASLTKPLCTTPAILHMAEVKNISLDQTIDSFFTEYNARFLKNITLHHLLSHTSGLPSYRPYFKKFEPVQESTNRKRLLDIILSEKLTAEPGEKGIYSDLGFILLGEIFERVTGWKLQTFFVENIAGQTDKGKEVHFFALDTQIERALIKKTAATQVCPWRGKLLQGEVDDEHCWLMNGVAGHAGLFGTIRGVLEQTATILKQWLGVEKSRLYSNESLQKALVPKPGRANRTLGFDMPLPEGSSAGRYISERSVGHLGFTGTSFWIDPEREATVVLLTNRVHPDRNNEKIKEYRPWFHDEVFKKLERCKIEGKED
ncbi:MAG: hypothetical protein Kow0089_11640 [Desulfobulbaceae bacterium]